MAVNNRVKITNDIELKDRLVAINRVTKVTKGGRTFSFSAIVVVGNEDGIIGWGLGKAGEVTAAIAKGVEAAKKNLTRVPVLKGTVPHEQSAKFGGAGRRCLCTDSDWGGFVPDGLQHFRSRLLCILSAIDQF